MNKKIEELIKDIDLYDYVKKTIKVNIQENKDKLILVCPFHEETLPSFMVVKDKNEFVCFGCGKSGGIKEYIEYMLDIKGEDELKKEIEEYKKEV